MNVDHGSSGRSVLILLRRLQLLTPSTSSLFTFQYSILYVAGVSLGIVSLFRYQKNRSRVFSHPSSVVWSHFSIGRYLFKSMSSCHLTMRASLFLDFDCEETKLVISFWEGVGGKGVAPLVRHFAMVFVFCKAWARFLHVTIICVECECRVSLRHGYASRHRWIFFVFTSF